MNPEFASITLTFVHGVVNEDLGPGSTITIPATEDCRFNFESVEKARDCFQKIRLMLALVIMDV